MPAPTARTARRRTLGGTLCAVAALGAVPATAGALGAESTYISFTDSVVPQRDSPLPDAVYGAAYSPTASLRTTTQVLRGGAVIASGDERGVPLADLQVGDVGRVLSTDDGSVLAEATFDGRPALDPAICAGALGVYGTRTPGTEVYVSVLHPGARDSPYTPGPTGDHAARITLGRSMGEPGDRFAGSLRYPLIAGQLIQAGGYRETKNGSTTTGVYSSVERAVPACGPVVAISAPSAPSPAPAPVKDLAAPVASFTTAPKLAKKASLGDLVKKGLTVGVTSREDAQLVATLSLQTSATKGSGAAAKPKKKKAKKAPKVEVIGTASAAAKAGQPVQVKLQARKTARKKLGSAAKKKGSKLLVNVTLTDAAGNVTKLPTTTLSLPKR